MQISKITSPYFGSSNSKSQNIEHNNKNIAANPNKIITVSRNALIAALTGILANCTSDTYYFSVTPEGNPIIYNQDGDSIDIIPRHLKYEYEQFCHDLEDNKNPNCTIAQGLDD